MTIKEFYKKIRDYFGTEATGNISFILVDRNDTLSESETLICPDSITVDEKYIIITEKDFNDKKSTIKFSDFLRLTDIDFDREVVLKDQNHSFYTIDEKIEFISDSNNSIVEVPVENFIKCDNN